MACPRDTIEYYIGDRAEEFAEWAFGSGFRDVRFSDMPDVWNELHGKKLELFCEGIVQDDIPKMIELWKQSNLN